LSRPNRDKLAANDEGICPVRSYQTIDGAKDIDSISCCGQSCGPVTGLSIWRGLLAYFAAQAWSLTATTNNRRKSYRLVRVMRSSCLIWSSADAEAYRYSSSLNGPTSWIAKIYRLHCLQWPGTLSLAKCMHADLRKTGIKVQGDQPGF